MLKFEAACTAAKHLAWGLVAATLLGLTVSADAAWNEPWKAADRAIVIDAYEFNPIDWKELTSDKRISAFINKASDGMPPEWNCNGKSGDDELLCKNRWWKYSVTKELFLTRREMAKTLGLKWGAYHLGRPGNPREQADHFIDFAEPAEDDLIALDIEDNTGEWMSLEDAEIFADQIFVRTGRYPVLYTNGSTAKWVADYRDKYPLLSRLPLWYARYREDITGLFPEDNWPSYALWQFSSMHNCSKQQCPYRVTGAKSDIDVNVSPLDVAGLRAAWPFRNLVRPLDEPQHSPTLVARLGDVKDRAVSMLAGGVERLAEVRRVAAVEQRPTTDVASLAPSLVAAYGPADGEIAIDPLKLITEVALHEREDGRKAATLLAGPDVKTIHPGKRIKVASLGSLSDLKETMGAVAAIPAVPQGRADGAKAGGAMFGAHERSKVRRWLELAKVDGRRGLAAPAGVLSQASVAPTGRGPRLVSAEMRSVAGQRIAGAFQATR